MPTAYVALGSNLGDRKNNLQEAVRLLGQQTGITIRQVSRFHETAPVGGPPGQSDYLNAAAEIDTDLPPRQLLQVLLDVERRLGRLRGERNAPRTIDLDLLLYDNLVVNEKDLTLPHPRMHERWFVLAPLNEIAPQVVHPSSGRTIRELLQGASPATSPAPPQGCDLSGLRALVTGSTSGIGRAIALELAAAGCDVLIHGRRSATTAEEVAGLVRQAGGRAGVFLADLRQPDECDNLVDSAWNIWAGLDLWVNNAGADTLTGAAARWSFEQKWQELFAVDVTATMKLSRRIGRKMKDRGTGVIVNMGWDQADTGMEGDSGELFAAAKGAVMAFTKSLALSLAPEVRVNCIAPGWIRTAWGDQASEVWQQRVISETPLGRWGTAEDVARTVRWLVSPAVGFVTGQVIRINGGAVR